MAFYTQVSTCIYKLEQDKLHTCDAVTPLHSFVLVVSGGLEISHHCRTLACASARGIVLSLFVCVCVCPPVFSVAARALSVKRGHVGR